VVESEGQVLGRIAALHNRYYSRYHNTPTGFFYCFDSVEDLQVSRKLFKGLLEWARARQLKTVLGPKGFLRSNGSGLLVEGFQYLPALAMPYNHAYYDALVSDAGFQKETDYLSGLLRKEQDFPERLYRVAQRAGERSGLWIKTFDSKREMISWIPRVNQVHQEAFRNAPGYYPTTEAEFAFLARDMIRLADPSLIKLVMKGEKVVGFILAHVDLSLALQKARGKLWPLGWLYFLRGRKDHRRVNVNGVGLLPAFQGLGGNALLYTELEKTLRAYGAEEAEVIQVNEKNVKSKADMDTMGVAWIKRHRTYAITP
jgi:hypothetical protein